ncbi:probable LysR-family transcriptional regulator [Burkholderia pseudomallei 1710b]|uniref:Probable LysR-family transcriptional regulator n=1 Tax=Burkholderia pseudomallei (strain 1710b) TaxID=320372 RepID=Q3JHN3_BURP1|nr:LysR substrate-binding domain-containing protein [Burkholderia pseudomallei]ABA53022.1 probable LysR-family transcriptional regulator [Burkholderia pseudomallei 1710b]
MELELNSNEGVIDLLERRTDVAIRIGRLKDSTLHSRLTGNSRLRILASPAYLDAHGQPRKAGDLGKHALLGFNRPESLNVWPTSARTASLAGSRRPCGRRAARRSNSSRSTARHRLPLGFHDRAGSRSGPPRADPRAPHARRAAADSAVYYRNTAISSRIASFVDYLIDALGGGNAAQKAAAWTRP